MSMHPTCLRNDFGGCQKAKRAKHSDCWPAVSQNAQCHHRRHGYHQAEECKTQSCFEWSRRRPGPFVPSTMAFIAFYDPMMRQRRGAGRKRSTALLPVEQLVQKLRRSHSCVRSSVFDEATRDITQAQPRDLDR
jgi:hypothetical protein